MRTGPRPLSVQIGMASSYWPYNPGSDHFPGKEFPQELEKMLLGIKLYQEHAFAPARAPLKKIWGAGTASLHAIPGHAYAAHKPALVLVPSLINKAYILDLMPGRSLLHFMAVQGIDPYLLDWGTSAQDESQQDIDGTIMGRLIPALRAAAQQHGAPVHALGYCMGGTLLTGAAARAPEALASITLLAAPWDFHAGSQALLDRVKFWAPTAFPLIDEKGLLPVDWIQVVFASLDPFMAARKFARFADMEQDSDEAHLFVAVEDWLNDGVDLPSGVAQQCIKEWFFENRPGKGAWMVGGAPVIPEEIQCPALIITSEKDRLVEYDTAAGLAAQMPRGEVLAPASGHIGMIAGGQALSEVWQPLARWIAAQQ